MGGLEELGRKADQVAKRMGAAFKKAGAEGLKGFKSGLSDGMSQVKTALGAAGGIVGTFSAGAALSEAQDLNEVYKNLAFSVRQATGEATHYTAVQSVVESTAKRWKRANGELAASFDDLFKTSSDLEFTRAALDAVGMSATATGANVGALTEVANELGEKFGIGAGGIKDAMATVIGMVPGGKAGIEELAGQFGLLGASARSVGLDGQAGLKKVLGMLNMAGASGGSFKKELMSVVTLMEQLGDADNAKKIEKALKVKITDKSGATRSDAIERIIQATGGKREELSKVFSGPLLRFMGELGKVYSSKFDETEGNKQKKTAAALEAFNAALTKASAQTLSTADLFDQATERLDDPKRRIQEAMNTFAEAFNKPEVADAMEELAKHVPAVAQALAKLATFVMRHPLLAGAGFIGGKALLGGASSMAVSFGEQSMSKAGSAISAAFAKDVAASGKWAVAGKALGVAAAAIIAFEIGKAFIDADLDKHFKGMGNLADAKNTAESMVKHGTGSMAEKQAAADALREQIARQKKNAPSFLTNALSVGANIVDPTVKTAEDQHLTSLAKAEASLRELEASMKKGAQGGEKTASAFDRTARAAERAATALERINPKDGAGGGRNGLPDPSPNRPGFGGG